MAFDVYAGPLCRYLTHDWKSVGQVAAETAGMRYVVVRRRGCSPFRPKPAKIADRVPKLRDSLIGALAAKGTTVERWLEDSDGDYFTDRPGWEGYQALQLSYAYHTMGHLLIPTRPSDASSDPVILECNKTHRDAPALLLAELWVPANSMDMFKVELPTGMRYGSTTGGLLRCLGSLVDGLNLDRDRLLEEHGDQPHSSATVEEAAPYGLGVMLRTAVWADRHRMPMLLDY